MRVALCEEAAASLQSFRTCKVWSDTDEELPRTEPRAGGWGSLSLCFLSWRAKRGNQREPGWPSEHQRKAASLKSAG